MRLALAVICALLCSCSPAAENPESPEAYSLASQHDAQVNPFTADDELQPSLPMEATQSPILSEKYVDSSEESFTPDPASFRSCDDGKRYCREMIDCDDAMFHLEQCGLGRLDGDDDGVPCETICGHN